ncbi:MAG: hypothetical protein H0X39_05425 [Actinobacteria bacterium]|nr:hypothetical protein [Actinomycetota bacterium]
MAQVGDSVSSLPIAAPKTAKALRDVILMPSLAKLLREHKLASAYSGPGDPVVATLAGQPMHFRNVTRRGFSRRRYKG